MYLIRVTANLTYETMYRNSSQTRALPTLTNMETIMTNHRATVITHPAMDTLCPARYEYDYMNTNNEIEYQVLV